MVRGQGYQIICVIIYHAGLTEGSPAHCPLPYCCGSSLGPSLQVSSVPLQKHNIPSVVLTLPQALRNSEGLSEGLHVPHFLGLTPGKSGLSFPNTWGVIVSHPPLAQGHAGHGNPSQRPTSPSISPPTSTSTLE